MSSHRIEIDTPSTDALTSEVRDKLRQMYFKDLDSFYLLIRAARVPRFIMKRCNFPVSDCDANHPKCSDITPYLGLVKSINSTRHAEIEPAVRSIILESITKDLLMPSLAFR